MRLDHIAYRVADRNKTAQFFIDALGYKIQQEFEIDFPDGTKAKCIALEPPEKLRTDQAWTSTDFGLNPGINAPNSAPLRLQYHLAPEIFVSDGLEGSIIGDWVKARGGIGGVHHMAYQTDDVRATMKLWADNGWAEFTTKDILTCPEDELDQVFTKPNKFTGIIYEFIKRGKHGFCKASVQKLMESTKGL